ncbi:hypothetical protein [Streptomyces sp. NPDC048637]|uniref:hypothetical protein n=1 Tax=Streptomyces sp. NPDC048637 TaxID=3155636 RepID=UPI0034481CC4
MSVIAKPTSRDQALETAFGACPAALYAQAVHPGASAALQRALELRSFLALAEEQVARVRDRVHEATAADGDMGALSAEGLRWDAQWLEAALEARDGYVNALDDLLQTMPDPGQHPSRPVSKAQLKVTATAPPVPPSRGAGAVQAHRP